MWQDMTPTLFFIHDFYVINKSVPSRAGRIVSFSSYRHMDDIFGRPRTFAAKCIYWSDTVILNRRDKKKTISDYSNAYIYKIFLWCAGNPFRAVTYFKSINFIINQRCSFGKKKVHDSKCDVMTSFWGVFIYNKFIWNFQPDKAISPRPPLDIWLFFYYYGFTKCFSVMIPNKS